MRRPTKRTPIYSNSHVGILLWPCPSGLPEVFTTAHMASPSFLQQACKGVVGRGLWLECGAWRLRRLVRPEAETPKEHDQTPDFAPQAAAFRFEAHPLAPDFQKPLLDMGSGDELVIPEAL